MCDVGKANHNDEPYIKPVIKIFSSRTEFLSNRLSSCCAGKIVRLLPNVNRQKMSPPIIKPVKKKFLYEAYVVTCLDTNALPNCRIHKCVNELSIAII